MRCLTLGESLRHRGHEISFCTNIAAPKLLPRLYLYEENLWLVSDAENARDGGGRVMEAHAPDGVDCLIVDHYGLGAHFEQACRGWGKTIIAIDDAPIRKHDCDILLDQTVGRQAEDYVGLVPEDALLMVSSDFALLRPQFAAARASLSRRVPQVPFRILVSIGGGSARDVVKTVLGGIDQSGVAGVVDLVLGGNDVGWAPKASDFGFDLNIYYNIDNMAELMARADISIGAAGTTSWERCCLALPSLLLVLADNQAEIAERLEDRGAALSLGWHNDTTESQVTDALVKLCGDPDRLAGMSRAAALICDGQGAERVASALEDNLAKRSKQQ